MCGVVRLRCVFVESLDGFEEKPASLMGCVCVDFYRLPEGKIKQTDFPSR